MSKAETNLEKLHLFPHYQRLYSPHLTIIYLLTR